MIALGVGVLGASITELNIAGWYASIAKPRFTPPNWLFVPVWGTLYVLMGISAWRVWRFKGVRSRELRFWWLQLAFNLGWSVIFFGLHSIIGALIEVALLLLLIVWTIVAFSAVDRVAGFLLWPYFGWTAFAAVLNLAIWRLNV